MENQLANAQRNGPERPVLLIFDVNETLIDFESLNILFARIFGDKRLMREWLGQLLIYSMTLTLSGLYQDYCTLGGGLLHMVGAIHGINIGQEHIDALKEGMKVCPAHWDAYEGLKRLRDAGYRMVALTNSSVLPNRKSPLENAGLSKFFEREFSTEPVQEYKPSSKVYRMVSEAMHLAPQQCCIVSTHGSDTIVAQSAGLSAVLLTRRGNAPLLLPGLPHPDLVVADFLTLAEKMGDLWNK